MNDISIRAIGDTHGRGLPKRSVDLYIVLGDSLPDIRGDVREKIDYGQRYYYDTFLPEIKDLSQICGEILIIGGNHDHFFDHREEEVQNTLPANAQFVRNRTLTLQGLNIHACSLSYEPPDYGSNWSFGATEDEIGATLLELADQDIDLLAIHTPPKNILDYDIGSRSGDYQHFGSTAYADLVLNGRIQPRLSLFGHIHGQSGNRFELPHLHPRMKFMNCAVRPQDFNYEELTMERWFV